MSDMRQEKQMETGHVASCVASVEMDATKLMVADAVNETMVSTFQRCIVMFAMASNVFIYLLGLTTMVAAVTFLTLGPLTWNYSKLVWWFERRNAPRTMGWRHHLFIYPSLLVCRWILGKEIGYLHGRFKATRQQGNLMIDLESIFQDLCEYLDGERIGGHAEEPIVHGPIGTSSFEGLTEGGEEEHMEEDPPDDSDQHDPNGDELVHMAINGIPLNGQSIDRTDVRPEDHPAPMATTTTAPGDNADTDMAGEDGIESTNERCTRYLNSSQDEVSEPYEWANVHYGHMDQWAYERMIAYSRANRIRLGRAAQTLRDRHNDAAVRGNWEEAANYLRALNEVQALIDLA